MSLYFNLRRRGLASGNWFLPHGIDLSAVLGAYQFKGQPNVTTALKNLTGDSSTDLTRTGSNVTWDADTGFHIPGTIDSGLKSTTLNGKTIRTIAVRYQSVATGNSIATLANPKQNNTLWAKTGSMERKYCWDDDPSCGTYNRKNFAQAPGMRYGGKNYYGGSRSRVASGVIIGVFSSDAYRLYVNGASVSLTYLEPDWGNTQYVTHGTTLGNGGLAQNTGAANNLGFDVSNCAWADYYMISAVFLSVALTAAQALQLTDTMQNQ